jgi:hypothetical protein
MRSTAPVRGPSGGGFSPVLSGALVALGGVAGTVGWLFTRLGVAVAVD